MKKFFCVLLSICLVLAAAACGKSEAPAEQAQPAANTPVEDPGGKPENAEPERSLGDEDAQLRLIADSVDLWYSEDDYVPLLYAVTDLDENGRYELISAITEGTGQFTTIHFWEVSADGQSLDEVKYDYGADHSEPDISFVPTLRCYSGVDGNYFVIEDYMRNGAAESYYIQDSLLLKNGRVSVEPVAYCMALEEIPEGGTDYELNFYYYSGQSEEVDLDRQGFIDAPNSYFETYERRVCSLFWTDIPADSAKGADILYGLLASSYASFGFDTDEVLFDSLSTDPEANYASPAVYSRDYLIDTWYMTHLGGEYDFQTAEEVGADSELSFIEGTEYPLAYFTYTNPTDARGTYLLTEMPVYDSDGMEAPAEGEIHVEFMTGGDEGEEINRFYAEIDPDDGSLWVSWFWWDKDNQGGDPTVTYFRYVKAEG